MEVGKKLRLIFMGSPDFAVPTLEALIAAGHEIVAVYAQPPRPAGRGKQPRPTPVQAAAAQAGIEVRTPLNFKNEADVDAFGALKADCAIVVAYGLILPKAVLEAPRLGCINVHASLLPRWRGAAPTQRAIQEGDEHSGVCIMQMEEGLDTGPVISRHELPITKETTGASLHDALASLGAEAINPALQALASGTVQPEPQADEGVTYAKKLSRDEAKINFAQDARRIERTIRAFNPWPGAYFEFEGTRIKVISAQALDLGAMSNTPGTVLHPDLTISCADGALRPTMLQRAGKGPMEVEAFLRGFEIPVGTVLS